MQVSKATREWESLFVVVFAQSQKQTAEKLKLFIPAANYFPRLEKKKKKRVNKLIETAATCRYSTEQLSLSCQNEITQSKEQIQTTNE